MFTESEMRGGFRSGIWGGTVKACMLSVPGVLLLSHSNNSYL